MAIRRQKKRELKSFLTKIIIKTGITKVLLRILTYKFSSLLRTRLYYIILIRRTY